MARNLDAFIASLPQEEQQTIQVEAAHLIEEEMTLQELRKVLVRSQEEIGKVLKVNQAQVSKIERRTDMYVSTLRSFIEAMGGQLEIIAHIPDHEPVRINQFEELGEAKSAKQRHPAHHVEGES